VIAIATALATNIHHTVALNGLVAAKKESKGGGLRKLKTTMVEVIPVKGS